MWPKMCCRRRPQGECAAPPTSPPTPTSPAPLPELQRHDDHHELQAPAMATPQAPLSDHAA